MTETAGEIWYKPDAAHPPRNVRVLVLWAGRVFRASRVVHPRRKCVVWMTIDQAGEGVFLPRPRDAELWGLEPDAWQPEFPSKWQASLPAPMRGIESRMWHERASFDAVAAAEEMEAEREAARIGRLPGGESKRANKRNLWWLDATLVTYSQPGAITKREAEGRIMRALSGQVFDGSVTGLGLHRQRALDDDALRAEAEAEALRLPSTMPRFVANGRDDADFDTAMSWFAALFARRISVRDDGRLAKAGVLSGPQKILAFASRDAGLSFA